MRLRRNYRIREKKEAERGERKEKSWFTKIYKNIRRDNVKNAVKNKERLREAKGSK